jgi:hypothetical protein
MSTVLHMSFILVPKHGEDIQVNGWNWRPTLELLRREDLISAKNYEQMSAQGCGGKVDAGLASRIADVIDRWLAAMKPGDRVRSDLTVSAIEKTILTISPTTELDEIDVNEVYSTTYEWLATFKNFCRTSGGFEVL